MFTIIEDIGTNIYIYRIKKHQNFNIPKGKTHSFNKNSKIVDFCDQCVKGDKKKSKINYRHHHT